MEARWPLWSPWSSPRWDESFFNRSDVFRFWLVCYRKSSKIANVQSWAPQASLSVVILRLWRTCSPVWLIFCQPVYFQAVSQGTVKCNFAGVALGDSWISPLGMGRSLLLSMVIAAPYQRMSRSFFLFSTHVEKTARWELKCDAVTEPSISESLTFLALSQCAQIAPWYLTLVLLIYNRIRFEGVQCQY